MLKRDLFRWLLSSLMNVHIWKGEVPVLRKIFKKLGVYGMTDTTMCRPLKAVLPCPFLLIYFAMGTLLTAS